MSKSWKVFLATAIGALIGGIVGESVISWLWWVGMIVGGFVGHFVYDWKRVVSAAGNAWRAAWRELPKRTRSILSWRPHPGVWRTMVFFAVVGVWFTAWIITGMAGTGCLAHSITGNNPDMEVGVVFFTVLTALVWVCIGILSVVVFFEKDQVSPKVLNDAMRSALVLMPFVIIPWLLYHAIFQAIRAVPVTLCFIKTFTVKLFLGIHSEERLICGVDAALGALIVHLAGGSLLALVIGTIAGGLIGVVNYEIITLRWLVPRGYVTLKD